jgi:hypothetical protein
MRDLPSRTLFSREISAMRREKGGTRSLVRELERAGRGSSAHDAAAGASLRASPTGGGVEARSRVDPSSSDAAGGGGGLAELHSSRSAPVLVRAPALPSPHAEVSAQLVLTDGSAEGGNSLPSSSQASPHSKGSRLSSHEAASPSGQHIGTAATRRSDRDPKPPAPRRLPLPLPQRGDHPPQAPPLPRTPDMRASAMERALAGRSAKPHHKLSHASGLRIGGGDRRIGGTDGRTGGEDGPPPPAPRGSLPALVPSNRSEAVRLSHMLDGLVRQQRERGGWADLCDTYDKTFCEAILQVANHCEERGELLLRIRTV